MYETVPFLSIFSLLIIFIVGYIYFDQENNKTYYLKELLEVSMDKADFNLSVIIKNNGEIVKGYLIFSQKSDLSKNEAFLIPVFKPEFKIKAKNLYIDNSLKLNNKQGFFISQSVVNKNITTDYLCSLVKHIDTYKPEFNNLLKQSFKNNKSNTLFFAI